MNFRINHVLTCPKALFEIWRTTVAFAKFFLPLLLLLIKVKKIIEQGAAKATVTASVKFDVGYTNLAKILTEDSAFLK